MEILPCPCGAIPVLESDPADAFHHWDIFCFNCGRQTTNHPSKLDAIRTWNQRVQQSQNPLSTTLAH